MVNRNVGCLSIDLFPHEDVYILIPTLFDLCEKSCICIPSMFILWLHWCWKRLHKKLVITIIGIRVSIYAPTCSGFKKKTVPNQLADSSWPTKCFQTVSMPKALNYIFRAQHTVAFETSISGLQSLFPTLVNKLVHHAKLQNSAIEIMYSFVHTAGKLLLSLFLGM